MNSIFFSPTGKLRSGWRVAAFISLFLFSTIFLTSLTIGSGISLTGAAALPIFVRSCLMLVPAIGLGVLCTRFFDGLKAKDLGISLSGAMTNTLIGFAIGAGTLVAAVLPGVLAGRLAFHYNSFDFASLLATFLIMAVAAAAEEALFRGYILQTLAREGYAWPAIVMTSAFFSLAHSENPNATIISGSVTFLAGIWFGAAYMRTRNLWFVWGIHLAWNWALGSVLGIEVSGLTDVSGMPLFRETDLGPQWLTGGTYGIEGSLAAAAAIIVSTAGIQWFRSDGRPMSSGDLDFEADVDGPGGVRQPADRDQIDSGVRK